MKKTTYQHWRLSSLLCQRSTGSRWGAKNSAKEAWEAIAAMRLDSDRAKKATTQLLKQEYANLKFKDGESVEDFSLRCSH